MLIGVVGVVVVVVALVDGLDGAVSLRDEMDRVAHVTLLLACRQPRPVTHVSRFAVLHTHLQPSSSTINPPLVAYDMVYLQRCAITTHLPPNRNQTLRKRSTGISMQGKFKSNHPSNSALGLEATTWDRVQSRRWRGDGDGLGRCVRAPHAPVEQRGWVSLYREGSVRPGKERRNETSPCGGQNRSRALRWDKKENPHVHMHSTDERLGCGWPPWRSIALLRAQLASAGEYLDTCARDGALSRWRCREDGCLDDESQ